jgi:hypothetical protein
VPASREARTRVEPRAVSHRAPTKNEPALNATARARTAASRGLGGKERIQRFSALLKSRVTRRKDAAFVMPHRKQRPCLNGKRAAKRAAGDPARFSAPRAVYGTG